MSESLTNLLQADRPVLPSLPTGWMKDAACRQNPEIGIILADGTRAEQTEAAQLLCSTCPVKIECLGYGLQDGQSVTYGGLSAPHRRRISSLLRSIATAALLESSKKY